MAERDQGERVSRASSAQPGPAAFVLSFLAAIWWLCAVAPQPAQALCANCLGQNRTVTPTLQVIGIFLALPFVVAYFVLRTIRRACRVEGRAAPPLEPQQLIRPADLV